MQAVLVIDDDAELRDTIGLMLEYEGFRPSLAADGSSGLKLALTPARLVKIFMRRAGSI